MCLHADILPIIKEMEQFTYSLLRSNYKSQSFKISPIGVDRQPQWGCYFYMNKNKILQTVVEMPEFIRQAATCMDEESKKSFIDYIAEHP